MTGPMTLTRTTARTAPVTTTEAKVIRGRIGSLNTEPIESHKPYTLKLVKVTITDLTQTEHWETVNQ